jgi:hypothetical protein
MPDRGPAPRHNGSRARFSSDGCQKLTLSPLFFPENSNSGKFNRPQRRSALESNKRACWDLLTQAPGSTFRYEEQDDRGGVPKSHRRRKLWRAA